MLLSVLDDELPVLKQVVCLLEKISDNNAVIDSFNTPSDLLSNFSSKKYDACFLDIDMPTMNGFDLSDLLYTHNSNVRIVFVTGKDDLVFHAFGYHAIGFVRKSNLENELKFAYETLANEIQKESAVISVTELRKNGGREQLIPIHDIQYMESNNHNVLIHTKDEKVVTTRNTLAFFMEQPAFKNFIPINSGTIVNAAIIKIDNDKIILPNEAVLYISRRKMQSVREAYAKARRRLLI